LEIKCYAHTYEEDSRHIRGVSPHVTAMLRSHDLLTTHLILVITLIIRRVWLWC